MDVRSALIITLISLSVTGEGSKTLTGSCIQLPKTEEEVTGRADFWKFHPFSGKLDVDLSNIVDVGGNCSSSSSAANSSNASHLVRVDLVSTTSMSGGLNTCLKPKKGSFVQWSFVANATTTSYTFNHIQGLYYIRLSHCGLTKSGSCKTLKGDDRRVFCIGNRHSKSGDEPLKFMPESKNQVANVEDDESCDFEVPTKISVDVIDSVRIASQTNVTGDTRDDRCDINVRVVVPLCASRQLHDTVTLTVVDAADRGDTCTFAEYEAAEKDNDLGKIKLQPCTSDDSNVTSLTCDGVTNVTRAAILDHDVRNLSRNSTYCLFFRLNSPSCQGQFGCVFYTEVISCDLIEASHRHGYRMIVTEPVFIAGVSLTLVASLALLAWTVIQVKKILK